MRNRLLVLIGASSRTAECLLFEDDFTIEFEWYTNNCRNSFVRNGTLFLEPTFTADAIGEANLENGFTMDICVSFKYGRVEMPSKLPQGDWIWPHPQLRPVIRFQPLPEGTFADNFHVFGLDCTAEGITTFVDNTTIMNVAVGGTVGSYWNDAVANKPWKQGSTTGMVDFWNNRLTGTQWLPTWGTGQQSAMAVDYVKQTPPSADLPSRQCQLQGDPRLYQLRDDLGEGALFHDGHRPCHLECFSHTGLISCSLDLSDRMLLRLTATAPRKPGLEQAGYHMHSAVRASGVFRRAVPATPRSPGQEPAGRSNPSRFCSSFRGAAAAPAIRDHVDVSTVTATATATASMRLPGAGRLAI
ncbi:concanavalin A-like lectin/glucanase domain-containing protein [Blyttiomyces helicus]|uniref:Concanavalin A-like lectin/glucanase domain-containing protein n=1 Tax=Blyttiomyces helicus TaxID=388810 RepID=A0A4P9WHI4_9FUNG|nr:concanavalin A-like lectin/glucanase domain-containing protein [Blyttiomyces helicus]|eukprot:RKO89996.1 concanavalin A-like lectin/glucanase domain-containing protein [Blyttiomyces helicus]